MKNPNYKRKVFNIFLVFYFMFLIQDIIFTFIHTDAARITRDDQYQIT